jgi:hypothetical protein
MSVVEKGTITVPVGILDENSIAGLRQACFDVSDVAGVDSGAGLGSPALWLWYKPEGGDRSVYAVVDARALLASWLRRDYPDDPKAEAIVEALGLKEVKP